MRYLVTVAGKMIEVDLRGPRPLVDGKEVHAELRTITGTPIRHLMVGNRSYTIVVERLEQKGWWSLSRDGRSLDVEALDERTRTIREMAGDSAVEAEKSIKAPMPGLVVRVQVEVGQQVSAGQGVIVVEAMKMENELKAPADGVVAAIEVAPGQPVEKGATLIVLE